MLAKAIDSYGYDSAEVFARVGLDHSKLRDPLARFPAPAVMRLWSEAAETTGDRCFGLTVASYWHPTTLHALGYSWLASNNLAEAFDCMVRYTRIVNTAAQGVLRVEEGPGFYKVVGARSNIFPDAPDAVSDAAMAVLVTMCRAAYGAKFYCKQITFQHDTPDCHDRFADLFQAPVFYAQHENALWLDPEIVREPLATANPELVRINDRIVTDYIAQLDRSDLGMRVRAQLIEHLPGGHISEAQIASALHVSRRTLQRKLRDRGMSFSQLVDTARRELGQQYVRDPQYSFNEIAFLLGFTEPANFSRAFKRWYGKTPSQYRQDSLS
jgi:AraC-like DNA-binding protein